MKDQNILRKTVELAKVSSEDTCIEVGCGEGWLSKMLADAAKSVHIIELDPRFLAMTQERLADYEHITFHHGDVLKQNLETILKAETGPIKIVANIPYYLSAKFIQWLVPYKHLLDHVVIMVQKEFAQKLVSQAGDDLYSSLAVYTQCHFETAYGFTVSKNCFRPIPKIDSAVLSLIPKDLPKKIDPETFFPMVNGLFWGKRKTVKTCLRKNPHITVSTAQLSAVPTDLLSTRGETLTIERLIILWNYIF